MLAAAAAVVVTALALGPLGPPGSPSDDVGSTEASMPLAATAGSSAQGGARLTARPWGTAVELDLTGLPPGERFVVWLVSTDGTREQAATWGSTPDGVARVTGASALGREVVGAVRVTTTRGRLVLSRDV